MPGIEVRTVEKSVRLEGLLHLPSGFGPLGQQARELVGDDNHVQEKDAPACAV